MNCIAELMSKLNITHYPPRWDSLSEALLKNDAGLGSNFLNQEYIISLHQEYRLFGRTLNEVLNAAAKLKEQPDLIYYILLLNLAMQDRDAFRKELGAIEPPCAPEGEDTTPYDFVLLFAVLPTIHEIDKKLRERGVPSDICYATYTAYEECLMGFKRRFKRLGFDIRYFNWIQRYIDLRILRIGRLNIEMRPLFGACVYVLKNNEGDLRMLMTGVRLHRDGMVLGMPGYQDETGAYEANFVETDDYYEGYLVDNNGHAESERTRLFKCDWHMVLTPDDPVLSVHIPADEKLSSGSCESAYARAREIFTDCFPEFGYKAFACFSWLMDPQLAGFLPQNSNIVTFQSKYMRFPTKSSGKAVLDFVFFGRFDCYENLPENTSLERSLKQHYLSGKYIYEPGGVFF